jgi:hypothetical protein
MQWVETNLYARSYARSSSDLATRSISEAEGEGFEPSSDPKPETGFETDTNMPICSTFDAPVCAPLFGPRPSQRCQPEPRRADWAARAGQQGSRGRTPVLEDALALDSAD